MLLVVHVGNMEERICFRLDKCRWHFVNPGNLDRMFVWFFSEEESFKTNFIVFFVFVIVDCILCQNALIDLSLVNLDSSCNLVKLLRALNKSLYCDVWSSYQEWKRFLNELSSLIVTVNLVEDDSCNEAFWLLLMIFCYLCQCFCIV